MNATERLRHELISTDQKHAAVAYRAGVSKSYVSRIAAGKHIPSLDVAERLAHALDVQLIITDLDELRIRNQK